ncbi:hypothetical protein Bp8pS_171 [Bacillus phage vB_BpuM-BpSp]|nr:hypothetical protein Bp8pS_171 [Bacillus phage vB_BpuM-BpSp]
MENSLSFDLILEAIKKDGLKERFTDELMDGEKIVQFENFNISETGYGFIIIVFHHKFNDNIMVIDNNVKENYRIFLRFNKKNSSKRIIEIKTFKYESLNLKSILYLINKATNLDDFQLEKYRKINNSELTDIGINYRLKNGKLTDKMIKDTLRYQHHENMRVGNEVLAKLKILAV